MNVDQALNIITGLSPQASMVQRERASEDVLRLLADSARREVLPLVTVPGTDEDQSRWNVEDPANRDITDELSTPLPPEAVLAQAGAVPDLLNKVGALEAEARVCREDAEHNADRAEKAEVRAAEYLRNERTLQAELRASRREYAETAKDLAALLMAARDALSVVADLHPELNLDRLREVVARINRQNPGEDTP